MQNHDRQKRGYIEHMLNLRYPWFVTLNFNRAATLPGARKCVGALLARIDRHYLGRWWAKRTIGRTEVVGVFEHLRSNPHFHCLAKFPEKSREVSEADIETLVGQMWADIVPSGSIDIQKIRNNPDTLGRYITKEHRNADFHDQVLYAREFWSKTAL